MNGRHIDYELQNGSEFDEVSRVNNENKEPNPIDNATKYLTVNHKGKFRWHSSFESLQTFMDKVPETETNWTSIGGLCKMLDLNEAVVRWYADSKSITVNGKSRHYYAASFNRKFS